MWDNQHTDFKNRNDKDYPGSYDHKLGTREVATGETMYWLEPTEVESFSL